MQLEYRILIELKPPPTQLIFVLFAINEPSTSIFKADRTHQAAVCIVFNCTQKFEGQLSLVHDRSISNRRNAAGERPPITR